MIERDKIVTIIPRVVSVPLRDVPFPAMGRLPGGEHYAVVFSEPDAAAVFQTASPGILVYCIRMPTVQLCASLSQAQEFFKT